MKIALIKTALIEALLYLPVALVAFFDDSFNANLHRFDWALASVLLKDNAALGCATCTEKMKKQKIIVFFL